MVQVKPFSEKFLRQVLPRQSTDFTSRPALLRTEQNRGVYMAKGTKTGRLIIDRKRVYVLAQRQDIFTVEELARVCKIHANTLSRILNGSGWQSQTVESLARALACHPFDLMVTDDSFPVPSLGVAGQPITTEYK
jgi:DNA-binding Xre family transcriptional regulator